MIVQKQKRLAEEATNHPERRFKQLYKLLHWDKWLEAAAHRVLTKSGSDTGGVDGKNRDYFKKTFDRQLSKLREDLKSRSYQPLPVKRVFIPKSNGKKRPLGIPALRDRIVQEALRMILEPIFESTFSKCSFGFRPKRCTMDAIARLMPCFNSAMKRYYVIEGDIKSYFDTVNHRILLKLIKAKIADKGIIDLIHLFLKAGVMQGQLFFKTEEGVPQGGIISPLFANIYLNHLDKWVDKKWHNLTTNERRRIRYAGKGSFMYVRYADDFVIVSNAPMTEIRDAKEQIKNFLTDELKLTLSDEKTKITHVNEGFDFLGFNIKRRKINDKYVTHLRPSEKSVKRIKGKIKFLTDRKHLLQSEVDKLTNLNQIVRGWCNYYKHTSLFEDLEEITMYTWHRYHLWLLKKFKGSRKVQLIREKTKNFNGRTRWYAEYKYKDKSHIVHQFLCTRKELKRSKYPQKIIANPFLLEREVFTVTKGEQHALILETNRRYSPDRRHMEDSELRHQAKMRDGHRCVSCGSPFNLQVHHKKGVKKHSLEHLVTLCQMCHFDEHQFRK